jgi:hypothetical protein
MTCEGTHNWGILCARNQVLRSNISGASNSPVAQRHRAGAMGDFPEDGRAHGERGWQNKPVFLHAPAVCPTSRGVHRIFEPIVHLRDREMNCASRGCRRGLGEC